jgi:mitochondrial chaperone BCS1
MLFKRSPTTPTSDSTHNNNKSTANEISESTVAATVTVTHDAPSPSPSGTISSSFIESLKSNPYFGAGFGLVGLGALLSLLKRGTGLAYTLAQKRFTVSLELLSKDKSYDWVLKWINNSLQQRARHRSVETFFARDEKSQRVHTSFEFVPSVGVHYMRYKSAWIRVERVREQVVDRKTGSQVESLKLTTIGTSTAIFNSLLLEARERALQSSIGKLLIYHANVGSEWGLFGHPRERRPFASVVLDLGLAESIRSDALEFLANAKWYFDRGIPYRRGYLLHGPPGCGKSSFITALAGR